MLLFVLLLLCAIFGYVLWNKNADYWKKRNIIQGDGLIWKFIKGNRSMPEYIKETYDAYDTHVGVFMGSQPALILKNLEDIQAVMAGDFQSFYSRGVTINANDVLADNVLFIDDYKRWKCIRQKLTPVFTTSKLKNMFYIMNKCAKDFVELIDNDKVIRATPFNALYTYTTASIGASVFGIDIKSSKSTMDSPFIDMAWKSVEPSLKTNIKFLLAGISPDLFIWLNLKIFGDFEEFFVGAVRSVMENRRNSLENKHDFIEICLELQKEGIIKDPQTGYELEPSVEVLAAQAFFFFIAGADTSANTMHFILLELAGHPEVLAKVHAEIDSIFQDEIEDLNIADIEKMRYLDMVVNESMRKYPTIGSLQRKCTRDTVLPGSKVKIDKDMVVMIPVYGIQNDAKYHPNPDVFDPERFASENLSKMNKYSFLPFGEGNRICLGNRFARLQMKAGLAWLLRKYTLAGEKYAPKRFERSTFSLRDTKARYELIPRDL